MKHQHFTHVTTSEEAASILEAMNTALDMKIYSRQGKSMLHLLICAAGLGFVVLCWCSGEITALSESIAVMFAVFATPALMEMIHSRSEEESEASFPLRRDMEVLSEEVLIHAAANILGEYNELINEWERRIEAEGGTSYQNAARPEYDPSCNHYVTAEQTGK